MDKSERKGPVDLGETEDLLTLYERYCGIFVFDPNPSVHERRLDSGAIAKTLMFTLFVRYAYSVESKWKSQE